jgi:hypothetical protein
MEVAVQKLWPLLFVWSRRKRGTQLGGRVGVHDTYRGLKPPGCETNGSGEIKGQSFEVLIFGGVYSQNWNSDRDAAWHRHSPWVVSGDGRNRILISDTVSEEFSLKNAYFRVFCVFDPLWRWFSRKPDQISWHCFDRMEDIFSVHTFIQSHFIPYSSIFFKGRWSFFLKKVPYFVRGPSLNRKTLGIGFWYGYRQCWGPPDGRNRKSIPHPVLEILGVKNAWFRVFRVFGHIRGPLSRNPES